jgi:uncharacterized protein YndB with AHSA1/START domain
VVDVPTARRIHITRVYDAPRELVWRAWTEPERLAEWWGKRGWSTPIASITMDVRPGGAFRLTSVSGADGAEMPLDAVYHDVVEPERLVFARTDSDALATVTFTDLGDGRTELVLETIIQATEQLRGTAEGGLRSAFDRLAEHLRTRSDP